MLLPAVCALAIIAALLAAASLLEGAVIEWPGPARWGGGSTGTVQRSAGAQLA